MRIRGSRPSSAGLFLATLAGFADFDPAGLFVHADNSAGLETTPGVSVFNAVRVGLLQFGVLPTRTRCWPA